MDRETAARIKELENRLAAAEQVLANVPTRPAGGGGGALASVLRVFRQPTQPTAQAGVLNIWEDTSDSHKYYYNHHLGLWLPDPGYA